MKIKLPVSDRRKALLLIDIQLGSLSSNVLPLVDSMSTFIRVTDYDAYVQVSYFADEESMLAKQTMFTISKEAAGGVAEKIVEAVAGKAKPVLDIEKNVRSCFKGFEKGALQDFLSRHSIQEVHLIGYDINDCVLASAYDAVDSKYYTYVIEELSHHWDGVEELKEAAIRILRRQAMTNNSTKEKTVTISFKE